MKHFTVITSHLNLPPEYGINCEAYINCGWTGENNTNYNFNKFIYSLIPGPLKVLELGCGGGGVVKHFLDDGHISFGIDAQPAYEVNKVHCWSQIPDNLYRCDIGKPFNIWYKDKPIKFDLIHSWECLEHIYEPDTDQLMQNIANHSYSGTYFMGSFSTRPCEGHRNIHDKKWWLDKFNSVEFNPIKVNIGDSVVRHCFDSQFLFLRKL